MKKVHISTGSRIHFWSIFTTALVGLFSFWLGITIQDDINTKNAKETQKLARYQMTEAMYPMFSQYVDTGYSMFFDFLKFYNLEEFNLSKHNVVDTVGAYYRENQNELANTIINSVNAMDGYRYYFGKESQKRICRNNTMILFGSNLLADDCDMLNTSIERWRTSKNPRDSINSELCNSIYFMSIFSFKEQTADAVFDGCKNLWKEMEEKHLDSVQVVNAVVYAFVFKPYIDNFNVFANELMPSNVPDHRFLHILCLLLCIVGGLLLSAVVLRFVFGIKVMNRSK